ncbi:UNVERIFIED_CONTAM: hypothetical protein PYX00_006394 [Menopon gallinae]|uniref:C3H1-type domain-containing protein n=1 Tax=Menopon gallinae TaxID=328185 RepID=A0AAW2HW16_9NEOP
MGRKKYYCDFCCRFFNDDKNIRSKHINSVAHQKAKADHYDLFKDPEIILRENSAKKPCRRFQNDGHCQFGSSCIYSHYSSFELDMIRQEIARCKAIRTSVNVPPPEAFVQKYDELKRRTCRKSGTSVWSHELPPNLLPVADSLPPSMIPFSVKIYRDLDPDSWG